MNKNITYLLIALGMLGYGCSETNELSDNYKANNLVSLKASVLSPMATTRASVEAVPYNESVPGPYSSDPTINKALDAAVWFTDTNNHTYSEGSGTTYPRKSSILFTSEGAAFPVHNLEYPSNNAPIYCVGLYPKTDWTSIDSDRKATHTINGSEDLMFAPEISGSYNSHFGTLQFAHQLTWLKIYVNATTKAIDAWGNLEKITVTSPGSTLTVDFTTNPTSASCNSTTTDIIAFEGSVALTVTDQLRGSIFCAPSVIYTFDVETENYNTAKGNKIDAMPITMKGADGTTPIADADAAIGKIFIITLNFKDINEIEGSARLSNMDSESGTLTLK